MERFTQRSNNGKAVCRCEAAYSLVHCTEIVGGEAIEYFAELEDKLESGQLVELPCKVGDILYAIMDVDYKYQIVQFKATNIELGMYGEVYFNTPTCYSHKLTFGKSVFGDKAQAEARLKELQEKL